MMFWRQRTQEDSPIPYFMLRNEVERMYGRKRIIKSSLVWIIGIIILTNIYYFLTDPNALIWIAVGLTLLGGVAGFVLLVVAELLWEALDHSKEEEWVDRSVTWIEQHGYHTTDQMPTRTAIRAMAGQGSAMIQINTPLPLALLAIVATISVSDGLTIVWRLVLAEILVLVLMFFPLMVRTAYADVIITRALDEVERRIQIKQPCPPSLTPHPTDTLLDNSEMLIVEQAQHHMPESAEVAHGDPIPTNSVVAQNTTD